MAAISRLNDLEARARAGALTAQLDMAVECDALSQPDRATYWLGQAARQGNLLAIAQLGARTVVGAGCPASLDHGRALLEFAARSRSPIALRHLSVLALAGAGGTIDLDGGIRLAAEAAAAGNLQAAGELGALVGREGDWASPAEIEEAILRAREACTATTTHTLSADPVITEASVIASPGLCQWLREWAEPALVPAGTTDRATGAFTLEAARTNRFTRIGLFAQPLELLLLKLRISAWVGEPVWHFEGTNVLAYDPGESFAIHHDYLDPAEEGFAQELEECGQRVATVLVALNDGYTGGETAFPHLGIQWRGKTGDALCFRNVDASGQPDERTLHAGQPPINGRKWILSQWVRNKPQALA